MEGGDVWNSRSGQLLDIPATTSSSPIIGLDFGSSNCSVSFWDRHLNRCRTVRDKRGKKITPANVTYKGTVLDPRPLIGLPYGETQRNTLSGLKGIMGEAQLEGGRCIPCAFGSGGKRELPVEEVCHAMSCCAWANRSV